MAYHLTKKYWFELTIDSMPEQLKTGFAKHKMIAVVYPRKKYNIYETEPTVVKDQRGDIKEEGIYIFGGEDANV